MKIVIGENLKTFRKLLGLSQNDLAEKLMQAGTAEGISVSYKTISKWESGNGYPETPMLIHLAKVLETTADFLLTGVDPRKDLLLEIERLKGTDRITCEHISYAIINGRLNLRFHNPAEFVKIEIIFGIGSKKDTTDITNDIVFNEMTTDMPSGAEYFALKCKLVNKPGRHSEMTITTEHYSLNI